MKDQDKDMHCIFFHLLVLSVSYKIQIFLQGKYAMLALGPHASASHALALLWLLMAWLLRFVKLREMRTHDEN
jgi:hypothetical protein